MNASTFAPIPSAAAPPCSPGQARARVDRRNLLLLTVLVGVLFLAVDPWAGTGTNDDYSYARTAQQLRETGVIHYNGGSTTILLPQALWGAWFIRLFGFSFTVLRFSILPFGIGAVLVSYILARQADLSPWAALLAALLLTASPMFLPLLLSFQTDVPAEFFLLLSTVLLIRAARSRRWLGWLIVGTLLSDLGGMNRQTGWIPALVLLPYFAWVRRGETAFACCALLLWVATIADAVLTIHWFDRQPYALVDPLRGPIIDALRHPLPVLEQYMRMALTLTMLVLPLALPAVLMDLRRKPSQAWKIALLLSCAACAGLLQVKALGLEPWMQNELNFRGAFGPIELSGHRAISQPLAVRGILSACTWITLVLLCARGGAMLMEARAGQWLRRLLTPAKEQLVWPAILLVSLAYLVLLAPRAQRYLVFDRYLLPLIPFAAILVLASLWTSASEPLRRIPVIGAGILLVLFGLYAFATTQDLLALARARGVAIARLTAAGVKPINIAAGVECDSWAQILQTGYINDSMVINPPHAIDPNRTFISALRPAYRLEFERLHDAEPTGFGWVDYFSLLPPFHRRIYIDHLRNSWWADPKAAATRPVPVRFEYYFQE